VSSPLFFEVYGISRFGILLSIVTGSNFYLAR
jgi:hypothetical protein